MAGTALPAPELGLRRPEPALNAAIMRRNKLWSCCRELNSRPLPYQGSALPAELQQPERHNAQANKNHPAPDDAGKRAYTLVKSIPLVNSKNAAPAFFESGAGHGHGQAEGATLLPSFRLLYLCRSSFPHPSFRLPSSSFRLPSSSFRLPKRWLYPGVRLD